jgi:hypothetical protein
VVSKLAREQPKLLRTQTISFQGYAVTAPAKTTAIIKKKPSSKSKRPTRDGKKEVVFRTLCSLMEEKAAVRVRREKLKQGHGWQAISGACRLATNTLLFVDSKLSQDEQIEFLLSKIAASQISFVRAELEARKLPRAIVRAIMGDSAKSAEDAELDAQAEEAENVGSSDTDSGLESVVLSE